MKDIYLTWLRTAWLFRKHFGTKNYGIGWIATQVRAAFDFEFNGIPFRFSPIAARSYCLLPANIPNEPETHIFFARVLQNVQGVMFIDVGASIGEFAIPMAHDHRVCKAIAFEPHPATAMALRASAALAPQGVMEIIEKGVSDQAGAAVFDLHDGAPTAAGIKGEYGCGNDLRVELCTLDETVHAAHDQPVILLIDIEGGELDALRGGANFIRNQQPLIVFEYNDTTRQHFDLQEAADFLGEYYRLYRLRSKDGRLDRDFSSTWNMVALPESGPWQHLKIQPDLFVND